MFKKIITAAVAVFLLSQSESAEVTSRFSYSTDTPNFHLLQWCNLTLNECAKHMKNPGRNGWVISDQADIDLLCINNKVVERIKFIGQTLQETYPDLLDEARRPVALDLYKYWGKMMISDENDQGRVAKLCRLFIEASFDTEQMMIHSMIRGEDLMRH